MAAVTCQRRGREKQALLTLPEMWTHACVYVKACLFLFQEAIWGARSCAAAKKYLPRWTELNFSLGEKSALRHSRQSEGARKWNHGLEIKAYAALTTNFISHNACQVCDPQRDDQWILSGVSTWEEINLSKWSWDTAKKTQVTPACPEWEMLKQNWGNLKNAKVPVEHYNLWPLRSMRHCNTAAAPWKIIQTLKLFVMWL